MAGRSSPLMPCWSTGSRWSARTWTPASTVSARGTGSTGGRTAFTSRSCATTSDEWAAMCYAVGLPELLDRRVMTARSWRAYSAEAFARRTAWSWKVTLDSVGVPAELPFAHPERQSPRSMTPTMSGWAWWQSTSTRSTARPASSAISLDFSETQGRIYGPAPLVGQHTREILDGIGLSQTEIDGLVASGVAYEPDENYTSKFNN